MAKEVSERSSWNAKAKELGISLTKTIISFGQKMVVRKSKRELKREIEVMSAGDATD